MEPQVLFRGRWGWGTVGVLGAVCVVVRVVCRVVCVVVRVVCWVVCSCLGSV